MPGGGWDSRYPAGSGGGRLGRFQFRYYSPDLIPDLVIQLRPADFTYTNFSRGRVLYFISTNVSCGRALDLI